MIAVSSVSAYTYTLMNCGMSDITGQVQSKECIKNVIRFAKEERLFLMADEVMYIHLSLFIHLPLVNQKRSQSESTKGFL